MTLRRASCPLPAWVCLWSHCQHAQVRTYEGSTAVQLGGSTAVRHPVNSPGLACGHTVGRHMGGDNKGSTVVRQCKCVQVWGATAAPRVWQYSAKVECECLRRSTVLWHHSLQQLRLLLLNTGFMCTSLLPAHSHTHADAHNYIVSFLATHDCPCYCYCNVRVGEQSAAACTLLSLPGTSRMKRRQCFDCVPLVYLLPFGRPTQLDVF